MQVFFKETKDQQKELAKPSNDFGTTPESFFDI